ncbi:hypothetical protein PGTUg99_024373 [Puccinia graminis f. sp. tritici]|uniref:Uncharacterized protein n=1 Tax=Puccinia graminis f. sp. tritici TaxID=56615 RepID=A0A5B0Q1M5_PUCGR|nr:hypothetical protein PGTUg99_024373 [Puccinia graminis f. sp. tritici]
MSSRSPAPPTVQPWRLHAVPVELRTKGGKPCGSGRRGEEPIANSSQQANQSQTPNQQPSQIPIPNPSLSKSITQLQGKDTRQTANLIPDPKGKETTSAKMVEPDPASQSSVTRSTLKTPIGKGNAPGQIREGARRGRQRKSRQIPRNVQYLVKRVPSITKRKKQRSLIPNAFQDHQQEKAAQVVGHNPELKGPIPLIIFNKTWQEEALSHHSKNRPKTEESSAEKNLRYHGLAVPDEWLQSFSDWTLNHHCFHKSIWDRYNYLVLAEWILLHKANCDRLQKKHGFMVDLRNDIRIRNNAFAFRVEKDGKESFSNISVFKPKTADDAPSESRNFNELGVKDSPYAIGGPRYGWDPHTGQNSAKTLAAATTNNNNNKALTTGSFQSTPKTPVNSLPPRPDQNRPPRSSGYKGRNYSPNHGSSNRRRGNE